MLTDELGDYIKALQALIEDTYYTNYNTPVVILGHSMGNPMSLYLLNHMTQEWKNKFIKSFISLAGVWGGAMKPIRLMISGEFCLFISSVPPYMADTKLHHRLVYLKAVGCALLL